MKKLFTLVFVLALTVLSASAQSSFELRYNEATGFFLKGEYKTAITLLQRTLSVDNLTKEQKAQANRLLNQCQQEIEAAKKFFVGRKNFENLSFMGGVDSTYINVVSKKAWHIVSVPAWVSATVQGDMIYFAIAENPTHEIRTGAVEITLDKTSTTYINFSQEARPTTPKTLNIRTEPRTVKLLVDNTMGGESPMRMTLVPGIHHVQVSRTHFVTIDTTVVVEDDLGMEDIDLFLQMKRKFATVAVEIVPEEGSGELLSNINLTIDGKTVDLRPNIQGDYNDLKAIEFYTLYSNGTIPLLAGTHVFRVSAPSYEETEYVMKNIENDQDYSLTLTLHPKMGMLRILDLCDARDADIYIDGKLQRGVHVPCDSLPVTTGLHSVTFKKEGMISTAPNYMVEILEKKTSAIDVSMVGYDTYTFAGALPVYATITIDSVEVGKTPLTTIITKGVHHIEIHKNGHLTINEMLTAEGKNDTLLYDREMPETLPFTIDADEHHLRIIVTQKDRTISSGESTPALIDLPLSDNRYKITLLREGKNRFRVAYKRYFRFNKPEKNQMYIQSWSDRIFQMIDVQYDVLSKPQAVFDKSYRHMGEVNFFKFQLVRGLSTSVVKGKVFLAGDKEDMHLTEEIAVQGKNVPVLPAFSCILINEEFRLGGALCSYVDANLLAAYTWYPNMKTFLPLSHVSGHDLFGGIEVATRFPVATLTVKFGYEALLNGEANIYNEKLGDKVYPSRMKNNFASSKLNYGQLQLGVGLSLGIMKSKGNNILRVF